MDLIGSFCGNLWFHGETEQEVNSCTWCRESWWNSLDRQVPGGNMEQPAASQSSPLLTGCRLKSLYLASSFLRTGSNSFSCDPVIFPQVSHTMLWEKLEVFTVVSYSLFCYANVPGQPHILHNGSLRSNLSAPSNTSIIYQELILGVAYYFKCHCAFY